MARFVAIHNFGPGLREKYQQAGPQAFELLKERYPELVWVGAFIEWETGEAVCVWEVRSAEAIKEHFAQTQTPYEDVFPVRTGARETETGAADGVVGAGRRSANISEQGRLDALSIGENGGCTRISRPKGSSPSPRATEGTGSPTPHDTVFRPR